MNRLLAHHLACTIAIEALLKTHPNPAALRNALDVAHGGELLEALQANVDPETRDLVRELVSALRATVPGT